MARSKDALHKRAEKRNRSVKEQRKADSNDMEKAVINENNKRQKMNDRELSPPVSSNPPTTVEAPRDEIKQQPQQDPTVFAEQQKEILSEPGAWTCQGCGNRNFASRTFCNSKMCDERRPSGSSSSPRTKVNPRPTLSKPAFKPKSQRQRHDPETSKILVWAENASSDKIESNLKLRKQYQETGGEGMSEEDITRAKTLLERDERKKLKKQAQKPKEEVKVDTGIAKVATEKNLKLRKQYQETGGEGMSEEDINRAKILLERDERNKLKKQVQKSKEEVKVDTGSKTEVFKADTSIESEKVASENIGSNADDDKKEPMAKSVLPVEESKEEAKQLKKKNKCLRKLYAKTGGKGMTAKEVETAKILLIERDNRKKRKRTEQSAAAPAEQSAHAQ
jgi:hypothetical protein